MEITGSLLVIITAAIVYLPPTLGRAVQEAEQDWDYVTVRKDAHMFWWLYYPEHPTKNHTQLPLVMWLQGGPGGSSCGFGNFEEIGPRDVKMNPRKSSWVQVASLLFVDNPVGSGYSYTTDSAAFTKDIDMVASDMLVLLTHFFKSHPDFQKTQFYIFSESYGGKMAAAIALELHKAITAGSISCTLGGVALGDSWISPIDSVLSWGPYLYSISLLDDRGLNEVQEAAAAVQDAFTKGQYARATELWSQTEEMIEADTDGVNFYNILTKESLRRRSSAHNNAYFSNSYIGHLFQRHVRPLHSDMLDELMNGPIRAKLKIIPDSVQWGGQAGQVFQNMVGDFMKPVVNVVDELLSAGINVTVYNGQLDLIVDTVGQETWVKKLKWKSIEQFWWQRWRALHLEGQEETAAFYKIYQNLSFYWIQRAGHMVPSDQPFTSLLMLRMILNQL